MMSDMLQKLTGSSVGFDFEGARYELSPLPLEDLARLKAFVKKYILQDAKETAQMMTDAGAPAEHIALLWKEAVEGAKDPLQSSHAQEPPCMRQMIMLSLQAKHPAVNVELVDRMLKDASVLQQMGELVAELNSTESEVKEA